MERQVIHDEDEAADEFQGDEAANGVADWQWRENRRQEPEGLCGFEPLRL